MAALWEKIQFWKKRMKYKIDDDFEFLPSDDDKITGIGILKGKYAGVLYHYGKARILEEGELARLTFSYTIIHSPNLTVHELQNDEEFHTMIGDILTEILTEKANEKTGNNYTEEFDF